MFLVVGAQRREDLRETRASLRVRRPVDQRVGTEILVRPDAAGTGTRRPIASGRLRSACRAARSATGGAHSRRRRRCACGAPCSGLGKQRRGGARVARVHRAGGGNEDERRLPRSMKPVSPSPRSAPAASARNSASIAGGVVGCSASSAMATYGGEARCRAPPPRPARRHRRRQHRRAARPRIQPRACGERLRRAQALRRSRQPSNAGEGRGGGAVAIEERNPSECERSRADARRQAGRTQFDDGARAGRTPRVAAAAARCRRSSSISTSPPVAFARWAASALGPPPDAAMRASVSVNSTIASAFTMRREAGDGAARAAACARRRRA